jgi:hypothetical protein
MFFNCFNQQHKPGQPKGSRKYIGVVWHVISSLTQFWDDSTDNMYNELSFKFLEIYNYLIYI